MMLKEVATLRRDERAGWMPPWAAGRGIGLAALLTTALLGAGKAEAQFTVFPGSVRFEAADSAASTVVYVRNDGSSPLQMRFYLGDFDQHEDGDYDFLPPGSTPRTCAGRLSVYPEGAMLAPGGSEAVRLRMNPGSVACWGMLFVETAPEGEGPIKIAKRVAAKVVAVPAGQSPEGEIASVQVKEEPGSRTALVEFRNTGEVPVYASGYLEIRSLQGAVVERIDIERFSVLPSRLRRLSVPLAKRFPAGQYLAVPVLDFGAEYVAGGQAVFTAR